MILNRIKEKNVDLKNYINEFNDRFMLEMLKQNNIKNMPFNDIVTQNHSINLESTRNDYHLNQNLYSLPNFSNYDTSLIPKPGSNKIEYYGKEASKCHKRKNKEVILNMPNNTSNLAYIKLQNSIFTRRNKVRETKKIPLESDKQQTNQSKIKKTSILMTILSKM